MAVGDLAELRPVLQFIDHFHTVGLGFQALTDDPEWGVTLGEEWLDAIAPVWINTMHFGARIRRIEVYPVVGDGPSVWRLFLNPRPTGTDSGQVAPLQCAALIRWTTGLAGRSNRGRTFLWVFSVYHVVDGWQIGEDMLARMQAVIDIMLATFGPGGSSPTARFVIISRTLDGVRRDPPVPVPVTGGVPVPMLATNRKRLTPGGGG